MSCNLSMNTSLYHSGTETWCPLHTRCASVLHCLQRTPESFLKEQLKPSCTWHHLGLELNSRCLDLTLHRWVSLLESLLWGVRPEHFQSCRGVLACTAGSHRRYLLSAPVQWLHGLTQRGKRNTAKWTNPCRHEYAHKSCTHKLECLYLYH